MNDNPELGTGPQYPVLQLLRRRGTELSALGALATFALALPDGRHGWVRLMRATALAVTVGAGLSYAAEMNEIIADTLLPQ
jgi:hypothetical protein